MPNENNQIPLRFIIDQHFLEYLFEDGVIAKEYLEKLNQIHRHENSYQWKHNVILDPCFKAAIKNKDIRVAGIISAIHPVNYWHKEGLYTSVIKYAISVADKKPYKNFILTSSKHVTAYETNKHYKPHEKLKTAIVIKSESEGLDVINEVYSSLI